MNKQRRHPQTEAVPAKLRTQGGHTTHKGKPSEEGEKEKDGGGD